MTEKPKEPSISERVSDAQKAVKTISKKTKIKESKVISLLALTETVKLNERLDVVHEHLDWLGLRLDDYDKHFGIKRTKRKKSTT